MFLGTPPGGGLRGPVSERCPARLSLVPCRALLALAHGRAPRSLRSTAVQDRAYADLAAASLLCTRLFLRPQRAVPPMTTLGADDDTSSFLERVLERVPGLNLLAVYDRDAVLIAKGIPPRVPPFAHSASCSLRARCRCQRRPCGRLCSPLRAGSLLMRLNRVLTDCVPSQAAKLQFGKNKHITAFYKDRTVVHINCLPLVISAVAAPNANIGLLLSMQQVRRTPRVLPRSYVTICACSHVPGPPDSAGAAAASGGEVLGEQLVLSDTSTHTLILHTNQRHSALRRSAPCGARRWAGTRAAGAPLC